MIPSSRVIFNTIVQYFRTIVFLFISLYTTRLILDALGVENYGIYSLIGGVVSLLSFIQASFSGTTQRYLSFYQGRVDIEMLKKIFNNSVITQLLIGSLLVIILIAMKPFLFGGFLNIPDDRLDAAIWVYYCIICTLFISMQATPYHATLISHENILFATFVQLFETFMKIPVALSLTWFSLDSLKLYAVLLLCTQAASFSFYYLYNKRKYAETKSIKLFAFDIKLFQEMFSFVGWTTYSTGCIIGRNQGIAILLNKFLGTSINAAYGLALTVSSQISFISTSIQNAINPQIIRAEGSGNRNKMLMLSGVSSKFSFLLLALISIPAIIEMNQILELWLKEVPEYTVLFCQFVLLANLLDQLTIGLATANRAIGNIRGYSLIINTIKLFTLPTTFLCLQIGLPIVSIIICFVCIKLVSAILRLPFLKITGGLEIADYSRRVFVYLLAPTALTIFTCVVYSYYVNFYWSFLGTFLISLIVMSFTTFYFGLCKDERLIIFALFEKFIFRINRTDE